MQLSARHRTNNASQYGRGWDQSSNELGMNAPIPSMPGRSQRILLNKRDSAAATSTASRLFKNNRGLMTATASARTRADHSASLSSSMAGSSMSSITARRAPSAGIFSSFSNTVESDNP
jgi:hypothetical protein